MSTFAPEQLASYDQARSLRDFLNIFKFGILPGDDQNGAQVITDPNFPWLPPKTATPGIYRPPWESGPAGFPEPNGTLPDGTKTYFLHYRCSNGKDGINVGLCIDKFKRYPGNPAYVIGQLAIDFGVPTV